MKDIIIVCAGGYGLEVYSEIMEINRIAVSRGSEPPYHILGFINDIPDALDGKNVDAKIIGPIRDWQPIGDEVYALGLSRPEQKIKIAQMLKKRGARFESIVSAYAHVSTDLEMGEGCFITSANIGGGVKLGNFVNINGSMIYGGAEIGDYSTTTGFTVVEDAKLGQGVFVGSKAVVTEGCTIGDGAKISAGSVVMEDVRSGALVFGMPAQEIG